MRIGIGRVGILAMMMAGMPGVAWAQPAMPRVLYLSTVATNPPAFAHPSRIHAGEVIAALGQSSGAFTVNVTEDLNQLSPANLATYDAVVFFTAGELAIDDTQKNALLQFVSSGKGFVGVHSATDTFYTWPAYGDLIGAYFENHPWDQAATIRVEDQTHRATKHLGASFTITDEIYQVRNWSRANVHVLLSLDLSSVPPAGVPRPDNDYALAWTRSYGAGRVFYSALGHHPEVWDDPRFQQHVLGGIRWALGDADLDVDDDSLPDAWETRFGLDRHSAAGDNGPSGDPDHDGLTNAQELAAGTHPHGVFKRYLAEGATGPFFDTRIALVNSDPAATAHAQLRFLPENGIAVTTEVTMPPQSRHTVFVDDVPGMTWVSFSTLVDADRPVVVDRTMTWAFGQGYGSHAETSVEGPSLHWYFAEGATHGRFDLFYLIQNPDPTRTAQIAASFLPPDGQAIDRTFYVAPASRLTIPVDAIPGLEAAEFAAAFASANNVPVIVERAMYFSTAEQVWAGGHDSAGATELSTRWFLAEGATGWFNTFILVGNPNPGEAHVQVRYLLSDGSVVTRPHAVAGRGRLTINLAQEDPSFANITASTIVESDLPVVAERAMWWPAIGPSWYEGHGSVGTALTGVQWALADGEDGGPSNARTYVLVATADGPASDSLRLTVFVEGSTPLSRVYPDRLTPNRRFSFDMDAEFPELAGRRFGVLVESLGSTGTRMPLVVERAMYHDANGVFFAAGTNVVATRIQ